MKTAIQKLISSVELMARGLNAEELYEYFIKEANRLLPAEREQIEEAFKQGTTEGNRTNSRKIYRNNPDAYFTDTYNE